jgi:small-conductance mechanosensitive channel
MKYQRKIVRCFLEAAVLLLLVTLSACNQNTSGKKEDSKTPDAVEKKRSEVMAIHDAIMPEMGTIMKLKKQLKGKVAAMDSTKGRDKEQLVSFRASIEQLETADEAMMQWMRTYKDPADSVSKEEAMEYLELKEQEILAVKEKMQESQAAAKALLNEN